MSILEMGHRDAGGPVQEVLQEALLMSRLGGAYHISSEKSKWS